MAYRSFAIAVVVAAAVFLAQQSLSQGEGNDPGGAPCCRCACTRKWPPESNFCFCGGQWEGSCPSVCNNCSCDANNQCTCLDGAIIKYCDCMADDCSGTPCSATQEEMNLML